MANLLLIDDDPSLIPGQVRQAFPAPAHRVEVAGTGAEGLKRVGAGHPDVILLDLGLPDQSGLEVYQQIRRIDARIPGDLRHDGQDGRRGHRGDEAGRLRLPVQAGRHATVASSGRRGAGSVPEDARTGPRRRDGPRPRRGGRHSRIMPGHARGVQGHRPRRRPGRPRADHRRERHRQGTGRPRHLPARPPGQSSVPGPQLRRHPGEACWKASCSATRKGPSPAPIAAASASSSNATAGRSSSTRSATCRLPLQAKILRVLQEQTFERVGGNETVRTDVRLIAATHRDLKVLVGRGEDSGRTCTTDWAFSASTCPRCANEATTWRLLAERYLRRYSHQLGRDVRELAPETLERLRSYRWPGNIRELQSVLKQALLRASGTVLLPAFLPEPLGGSGQAASAVVCGGRTRGRGMGRPPAAWRRRPRPVRQCTSRAGPALAAAGDGIRPRQSASGRPPAGHCPANPAPETP